MISTFEAGPTLKIRLGSGKYLLGAAVGADVMENMPQASIQCGDRRERYGLIGWVGFFALCLLGLGLPLIAVSWLGGEGGRSLTLHLSRLAGAIALILFLAAIVAAMIVAIILVASS